MNKLVVLGVGALGAASVAVLGAGVAASEPNDNHVLNVVGEPYAKALTILKQQGVKATFGGSFGSALPQAQCLVDQQKVNSSGKMLLMLDCSQEAADQLAESGPAGGPTVGSNGVTTVTPTPVVPIQGAPGAGAPPPPA
ncbi:hypothetical protein [Mycobacterium hubeiense]|uniref:hypothetical protein n=1 Tax=Mycobacterium hubeiense TaxID=1867256 RepID=UPI000C7F4F60|nr:hypothetical protein [Mycobacterium sp. QGD 101]